MSYPQYSGSGYSYGWPTTQYPAPTPAPEMPMQQNPGIIRVSGMQGAQAFRMAPNSEGLFLDSTQPVVWLKTTDGAGYPTLSGYNLIPMTTEEMNAQSTQVKQIEVKDNSQNEILERLDRLERMIENVSAATTVYTEPKYVKSGNGNGPKSDQKHDRNDQVIK